MMGSIHDEYSNSFHSTGSLHYNANPVVAHRQHPHQQQQPTAASGYQRGNGSARVGYVRSKQPVVSNGRTEPWQHHQPSLARGTRPATVTLRPASSMQQLTATSRRDYGGGVGGRVQGSGGQLANYSRSVGRPLTPAEHEYIDDRYCRTTAPSLNRNNVTKTKDGSSRLSGHQSSGVGSIMKLSTPRNDRVSVIESTSLRSWNDDQHNSAAMVKVPPGTGSSFRNRSIDADNGPRALQPQPRHPKLRASSSSPTRTTRNSTAVASSAQRTPVTPPRHRRRVLFKNNVAVYRFESDSGVDSSAYSSMSESSELLNGEPRHHHGNRQQQQLIGSSGTLRNGYNGAAGGRQQVPVPGDPDSGRPRVMPVWYGPLGGQLVGSSLRRPSSGSATPVGRCQSPASFGGDGQSTLWVNDSRVPCQLQPNGRSATLVHIHYVQLRDGSGPRLVLTCQLRSGCYWDSDDIVVKANRSGSRVRIVFGGGGVAGPSDQLVLPVTVDPYRLVARLEPDTTLVIEAPVIH